jgi:hypothetical protein
MIATTKPYRDLPGDWRRRGGGLTVAGTKTDAHLYGPEGPDTRTPLCNRRIPRTVTVIVNRGRPCTDCLIAAVRAG